MRLTLKQIRLIKEKTQTEMAAMLNIHVDTYRKLEEKPENATIKQAKMISEFLNVPFDEIFLPFNTTESCIELHRNTKSKNRLHRVAQRVYQPTPNT